MGAQIHEQFSGARGPSFTEDSALTEFYFQISDILLHFETPAVQTQVVSKSRTNFALFGHL